MAEKKRKPKGIAARVGKHTSKQVKVEFTQHRKQGGSVPNRLKGGKTRKPIPSIRARRTRKNID